MNSERLDLLAVGSSGLTHSEASASGSSTVTFVNQSGGPETYGPTQLDRLRKIKLIDLKSVGQSWGFDLDFSNAFAKANGEGRIGINALALTAADQYLHVSAAKVTNLSFVIVGSTGGEDDINTGSGNDTFIYAGTSLDVEDSINGGGGHNTLVLTGGGNAATTDGTTYLGRIFNVQSIVVAGVPKGSTRTIQFGNTIGTVRYTQTGVLTITTNANYGKAGKAVPIAGALDVDGEELDAKQILHVTGGTGNDTLIGGAGNDVLIGGAGDDTLVGGGGDDTLIGGAGNNSFNGGTGANTMIGGSGNDLFDIAGSDDSNSRGEFYHNKIVGAGGFNTLEFASQTSLKLTPADFAHNTISGVDALEFAGDGEGAGPVSLALSNAFVASNHGGDGRLQIDIEEAFGANGLTYSVNASAITNAKYSIEVNIASATIYDTEVLTGGAGDDVFRYAGIDTLNFNDRIDGGGGYNEIVVQAGGSADLGRSVTHVQRLEVVGGKGEKTTTVIGVAVGEAITIDGRGLGAGDALDVSGTYVSDDLTNPSTFFNAKGRLTILGGAGDDELIGGAGDDVISGGGGNDVIAGGYGADRLSGGAGANVFLYQQLSDSTVAASGRDVITDFNGVQGDRLDVAELSQPGPQGQEVFSFIGDKTFTGVAGQIRDFVSGGNTYVQLDNIGAGKADFEVELLGKVALTARDFITVFTP